MLKRYAHHPLQSVGTDILVGLVLLISAPFLFWQSILTWFWNRCDQGKHWERENRTNRYGHAVEWQCRICKRYRWHSQGVERYDKPPWYS